MNLQPITPGRVLDYLLAKLVEGACYLSATAYCGGKRLYARLVARN